MRRVVHLLSGLEVGGKERVALKLARRGRRDGFHHDLLLFDRPFRGVETDFDPGEVPVTYLARDGGLDLPFARRLARWLGEQGVEALHAHNDSALVYGVLAARRVRARPRVVGTFHTRPSHPTLAGRILCRWASKRADAVTAVSPDLARDLIRRRWLARCRVLWSGVETEEYRPQGPTGGWREKLGLPRGGLLLGLVGRIDRVKRQADLLEAIRSLRGRSPPLVAAFVGRGPTLERFREETREDPDVRVLPRVLDMPPFLRALDLFVLCSEEEAAPMVLLEAMGCGRACVVTDAGSMATMVDAASSAPCGRVVPPRRPDLLAGAIRELVLDEPLRRALGERARARVVERFGEEREWAEYLRLYGGGDQGP